MKAAPWENSMKIRLLKWILLGPVVTLLLLGHGLAAPWWGFPPSGQPGQMWSNVDYDATMTDPFFKSNESGCPDGCTDCPICQDGEPHVEHTARCFSTSLGNEHLIRFCYAKLVDVNTIHLLILESNPEFFDELKVRITNGMFTSLYWTGFKAPQLADWTWTTKRQELTLNSSEYRIDDVIKGRIDFECVQEATNPKFIEKYGRQSTTIKIHGVFKTIVK
jgi:hypothetical protein